MNLFKRKTIIAPLHDKEKEKSRKRFISKFIAGLFGTAIIMNSKDLYSIESKTGFVYVKKNGEVINNYKPQSADPFLGEINIFPFSFAPYNWALCNGGMMYISQNSALFSLLGTYYGGDGRTTFALPNFSGSAPIHIGGPSGYSLGEIGGSEFVTLYTSEMPQHSHQINASTLPGSQDSASGAFFCVNKVGSSNYSSSPDSNLAPGSVGMAGGGEPVNLMQPFLGLSFCIALAGIYPTRP